jgi:UDP-N-acetylmuramyl pentapeptide phosphotransferase/UDP-N-acetylglucosamine-1-phosphate transferase
MRIDWVQTWVNTVTGHTPLSDKLLDGVKYASIFMGALVVSLILTPLCRELVRKLGMIDQPDARRVHKKPIPRGGGLSVFFAFHLVLGAYIFLSEAPIGVAFSYSFQGSFFVASLALLVIGFVDDKWGMHPAVKLTGQILVATFLFVAGVRVGGIFVAFPLWLDYAVTVFWIVGAINAFNLIDGLDGLASGLAMIASGGIAGSLFFAGQFTSAIPYLALCGACLGFLRYNFHPATVFLGDTGSMFLGLCMAVLPLESGSRMELLPAIVVPLLAMGVPLFDTLLAIWRRTVRALLQRSSVGQEIGKRIRVMQPDKDHVHHRVLESTLNQRNAALVLYGISAALVAVAWLGVMLKKQGPGVFLMAFIVAVMVIVRHLARIELWDTGKLLSNQHVTIRNGLITPLFVLFDLMALSLASVFAYWIIYLQVTRVAVLTRLPLFVVSVFVMLVLAKTYRRVWSRTHFADISYLIGAVFMGALVGSAFLWLLYGREHIFRFVIVFMSLATIPIVGIRLLGETLRGAMTLMKRRALLNNEKTERILVYGAGMRFRNYLRIREAAISSEDSVLVGLIDDHLEFADRVIYSYDVLGNLDDIPVICKEHMIKHIVLTCSLPRERQNTLLRMAQEANVKVTAWSYSETQLTTGA